MGNMDILYDQTRIRKAYLNYVPIIAFAGLLEIKIIKLA